MELWGRTGAWEKWLHRGIAAANVEIEKTGVSATTIHNMFEESFSYVSRPIRLSPVTLSAPFPQQLSSCRRRVCASAGPWRRTLVFLVATSGCQFDGEYKTKLDLAKLTHPKVADLVALQVLLLDEVSMLDKLCFEGIQQVLDIVDHNRRPDAPLSADPFGEVHLLLFGDYKQLPPASSQAPFIIIPSVVQTFEFRCLRQNRRVVQQAGREAELEIATRKQTTTTTNSGGGVRSALKTT